MKSVMYAVPRLLYPKEWSGKHCIESWVNPTDGYGQVRKISMSPDFDPKTVQPVACRCTDFIIRLSSKTLDIICSIDVHVEICVWIVNYKRLCRAWTEKCSTVRSIYENCSVWRLFFLYLSSRINNLNPRHASQIIWFVIPVVSL